MWPLGKYSKYCLILMIVMTTQACVHRPSTPLNHQHSFYLPFAPDKARLLVQGPKGMISHRGSAYEYDFLMPVATPILAAKSGVVVAAQDHRTGSCPWRKNCRANFIVIKHP